MVDTQFIPEPVQLARGALVGAEVECWNVEGYPVVNVLDGKTGMIALFGEIRAFPIDSAYKNGHQTSKAVFLKTFPKTRQYFEK